MLNYVNDRVTGSLQWILPCKVPPKSLFTFYAADLLCINSFCA